MKTLIDSETISDDRHTTYSGGIFAGQRYQQLTFTEVEFVNCDFSNAIFTETAFRGCLFYQCSFIGAKIDCVEFSQTHIIKCNFNLSVFNDVEFIGCQCPGMWLSGTNNNVDLRGATGVDGLIPWTRSHEYAGYRYGDRARMGCQEHSIEEWRCMTRNDVATMAHNGIRWYDEHWSEWMEFLS